MRKIIIKTENQCIVFPGSSCQDYPETDRSTGAYIVFYHGVPIDHFTHVPGPFAQ